MPKCHTPDKAFFPTRARARAAGKACLAKYGTRMWAYRCKCGAFHLTSHKPYRRSDTIAPTGLDQLAAQIGKR